MELKGIKTPNDILEFMNNIQYGWLDINGNSHIKEMENFKSLYRTSSLTEIIQYNLGTCIEQAYLMHTLLDLLGIVNKLFCMNVSKKEIDNPNYMHCFVLYFLNDKVYQIEHPDFERVGIHEFDSEDTAIEYLKKHYEKKDNGIARTVTEFSNLIPNLTFDEFNIYIDSLRQNKKTLS